MIPIPQSLDDGTSLDLTIDFTPKTLGEWQNLLSQCPNANWLQAWPYATASFKRDHLTTKLASIRRGSVTVGIFAVQEIKLGPIHILNLNRGPLWFSGEDTNDNFREFCLSFAKSFPKRLLRRRRWIVERPDSDFTRKALIDAGFQKCRETYATVWIDLQKPIEHLQQNLHRKWRNHLAKALSNSDLSFQIEVVNRNNLSKVKTFLSEYDRYKNEKGFVGPTSEFIFEETAQASLGQDVTLFWALENARVIGGMLIERHGKNISYRIGWNSKQGRKLNAHYMLLWQAILHFKKDEMHRFDLGGLLEKEAPGISEFKIRTGADRATSVGIFS